MFVSDKDQLPARRLIFFFCERIRFFCAKNIYMFTFQTVEIILFFYFHAEYLEFLRTFLFY